MRGNIWPTPQNQCQTLFIINIFNVFKRTLAFSKTHIYSWQLWHIENMKMQIIWPCTYHIYLGTKFHKRPLYLIAIYIFNWRINCNIHHWLILNWLELFNTNKLTFVQSKFFWTINNQSEKGILETKMRKVSTSNLP